MQRGLSEPVGRIYVYPTRSNSTPTLAAADVVGNISNAGANVANHSMGADWNGEDGNVTTVGSAGPLSASFYGTYDQGGNVQEWNELLVRDSIRSVRGDSYFSGPSLMRASIRAISSDTNELLVTGFRVATVPEPTSLALAAFGVAGLAARGYRRRAAVIR